MQRQHTTESLPGILIVDDQPENLRLLAEMLKYKGYAVRLLREGHMVLSSALNSSPDLILLDIMMPDMSGYEVCQQLKSDERTCDIPVIFISALDDVTDKVKGFAVGGVDYITKPFQQEEVLARVTTHVTLRKAQQQLHRQNAQLQELNASKDTFFSIISHDLRSPFQALFVYAQMLVKHVGHYPPDTIKAYANNIYLSANRLFALLENLLTWSLLQRGVMEYTPKPLKLAEMVADTILLFRTTAAQKQVNLVFEISDELVVYGDESMLKTVLRNLISNALKFSNAEDRIIVSSHPREEWIEVAVADTGIGIAPEALLKLFRVDKKHSTAGTAGEKGSGLGLSLCQDLIQQHGGTIWVESEQGTGTTFTFTLPRHREENSA
jgi:two-component system, sensor histidine kinase and response regulator